MAIPDGKPATDFSAMNREWVRAVAEEAAESGGGGIPAPENPSNGDVLTYSSTDTAWVAAAPAASGIPAPANPSNGDVLTYDSTGSAWVAAAPGGGGGGGDVFLINITQTASALVTDKTAGEIKAALEAGKILFTVRDTSVGADIDITYSLVSRYMVDQGEYIIVSSDNEYVAATLNDYMECSTL